VALGGVAPSGRDSLVTLWFNRMEDLQEEFTGTFYQEKLHPDEPNFIDPSRSYGVVTREVVVYGGFDMARFQPMDATHQRQAWGLEPHHVAFAVVGTYDLPRGKGQREFLKAVVQVRTQCPNARFLIVGRGNMKEILEADIGQLGLKGVAWLTPYSLEKSAWMAFQFDRPEEGEGLIVFEDDTKGGAIAIFPPWHIFSIISRRAAGFPRKSSAEKRFQHRARREIVREL